MKAKLIYILNDEYGYGKTAFYEYRNHEYMIHFCNNGCMDDMNVIYEHKHQQELIDSMIDNPVIEEPKAYAGATLDEIFELLEIEV